MVMVAALASATFMSGCKEKGANAGGAANPTPSSNTNGNATPVPAKPPVDASGPQATLDTWVEAVQLEDFLTAVEMCDEACEGREELVDMSRMWENLLDKVDNQMQGAEMALELTRTTLLGPWKEAKGEVTQTEGNFAQATVRRGNGAEPLMVTLNKQPNGKWMVVAPGQLFGGGAAGLPSTPK